MEIDELKKCLEHLSKIEHSNPVSKIRPYELPKIPQSSFKVDFDFEKSPIAKIQHNSEEQNELLKMTLEESRKQNDILKDNYNKLKDLYDSQTQSYVETKEELKKSKIYNFAMMGITIVSTIVAIASLVYTIFA